MAEKDLKKNEEGPREISTRTATVVVVLFGFTVFGLAALLSHPASQQLLGLKVTSLTSKAYISKEETSTQCLNNCVADSVEVTEDNSEVVNCFVAPCPGDEIPTTKEETPVINCIQAPCPGGPLSIETDTVPSGYAGVYYETTLEATGGSMPYQWSVTNTLTTGLKIDETSGMLSGIPKIGLHRLTITLTDSEKVSVTRTFTLQIAGEPVAVNHSAGTLVLGLDNEPTSVELIVEKNGQLYRMGFPDGQTFISHGYKWENIVRGNTGDQALPWLNSFYMAPGSLVNDGGTVYAVYPNNVLRGFTSIEVFQGMGYHFDMVVKLDQRNAFTIGEPIDRVQAHAPGTDIVNLATTGVSRIMNANARFSYSTVEIYNSWHTYNFDFSRVVPENEFDSQIAITGTMPVR